MKSTISIILIFCAVVTTTWSQQLDSAFVQPNALDLPIDSTQTAVDTLKKKRRFRFRPLHWVKSDYPNPKKALILSIIPGMGQAYNKKYWKIPIVYAAIGGLAFVVDLNNRQYNRLQTAYLATVDEDESTVSEFEGTRLDNGQTLRNLRNGFDKNRQRSWFGLIAVYLLGGVDAFVDGHLLDFDVSDDLSLKLQPDIGLYGATATPTVGVGVSFQMK